MKICAFQFFIFVCHSNDLKYKLKIVILVCDVLCFFVCHSIPFTHISTNIYIIVSQVNITTKSKNELNIRKKKLANHRLYLRDI